MITILVGSLNPVKINAAKESFAQYYPIEDLVVVGHGVSSGVSDQPMSDAETFEGAKNRVEALKALGEEADFYIAFEGGVDFTERGIECFAWLYGESQSGTVAYTKSATFFAPESFRQPLLDGVEMGDVLDIISGQSNSKQKGGLIGYITDERMTRTQYYVHPGICLIPQLLE